jgi:F-box-like
MGASLSSALSGGEGSSSGSGSKRENKQRQRPSLNPVSHDHLFIPPAVGGEFDDDDVADTLTPFLVLLPREVLASLLRYLAPADICALASTSRTLFSLTGDDLVWRGLYRRTAWHLDGDLALDAAMLESFLSVNPHFQEVWAREDDAGSRSEGQGDPASLRFRGGLVLPNGLDSDEFDLPRAHTRDRDVRATVLRVINETAHQLSDSVDEELDIFAPVVDKHERRLRDVHCCWKSMFLSRYTHPLEARQRYEVASSVLGEIIEDLEQKRLEKISSALQARADAEAHVEQKQTILSLILSLPVLWFVLHGRHLVGEMPTLSVFFLASALYALTNNVLTRQLDPFDRNRPQNQYVEDVAIISAQHDDVIARARAAQQHFQGSHQRLSSVEPRSLPKKDDRNCRIM